MWPAHRNCTGAALASVQHGGGFGWHDGQMANSANGAAKVTACMGNASGTLKPKARTAPPPPRHACSLVRALSLLLMCYPEQAPDCAMLHDIIEVRVPPGYHNTAIDDRRHTEGGAAQH